ncbi:MAG TPA: hypothetical protein VGD37_26495 [Kofleriaceae bacterium]
MAAPAQLVNPSVVMAVRVIWNPFPAGIPLISAVSFVEADTSMVPVRWNPSGPVIEKLTLWIEALPGICNARPTSPVASSFSVAAPWSLHPRMEPTPQTPSANIVMFSRTLMIGKPPVVTATGAQARDPAGRRGLEGSFHALGTPTSSRGDRRRRFCNICPKLLESPWP